jgi:MFS family permease
VLVGVCSIYFTSLGNSVLQLESNAQMRGRVMAFWSIAFLGSTTIGGPVVGWFAEVAGPRWGLGLGGIAAIAAAGFGIITLGRLSSSRKILGITAEEPALAMEEEQTVKQLR